MSKAQAKQLTQDALAKVEMQDNPGSTTAKIAILSDRITNLQNHLAINKKDKHSRRGLLQKVADRRKLIKYMKRTKSAEWGELAAKLGLKA